MDEKKEKIQKAKRTFILQIDGKDSDHKYHSVAPRSAALKAANAGFTDIVLREACTRKLHIFVGSREKFEIPEEQRPKDKDGKSWLPSEVWRPNVKKKGIVKPKKK